MTDHILYILSNPLNGVKAGPVFIGETSDLLYRMTQHRSGRPQHPAFALDRLVYTESYDCQYKAQARVGALKSASRQWLDALITSHNPAWAELLPMDEGYAQAA